MLKQNQAVKRCGLIKHVQFNKNIKDALKVILILIVANGLLAIISGTNLGNRPIVNYDLCLAIALVPYSRFFSGILIVIVIIIDLVVSQARTFYFLSTIDFIKSAAFIENLDLKEYISITNVLVVLMAVACAYAIFGFSKKIRVKNISVIVSIAFLTMTFFADMSNGTAYIAKSDRVASIINIGGSPGKALLDSAISYGEVEKIGLIPSAESLSDKFSIVNWAKKNEGKSVLLVIVESLGNPESARVHKWLSSNLDNENYKLKKYVMPFRGSTTNGELRVLCELKGSYRYLTSENNARCLPVMLREMGWVSFAYHGFSKKMFERDGWWPKVGFKETSFREQLIERNIKDCGASFRGSCDDEVIHLATSAILPNSFTYVLTLNTHLPVIEKPISEDLQVVCEEEKIAQIACMHLSSLGKVLKSVVANGSVKSPPPLIVVVGDHPPPFAESKNRNAFNQKDVPIYILEPKSSAN